MKPPLGKRFHAPHGKRAKGGPEAPAGSQEWATPWAQLKYWSFHPSIFKNMVGAVSAGAKAGDRVAVYDKEGQPFGTAFYHPKAPIGLRVFHHGAPAVDEAWLDKALLDAIELRVGILQLDAVSEAYRVVHSDADRLSGLMVDRYGEALSIEVSSLAAWQRLPRWIPLLHERLGTRRALVQADPMAGKMEGFRPVAPAPGELAPVKIREHGVRFEVDFSAGHKTGFFCDQRDNRRKLAGWMRGGDLLDLCCYSGGFAITAKMLGKADEVTAVDLDENAIAQAKRNANLNQVRIKWVHADAFPYARQMQANGARWPTVVLDPPKFILHRDEFAEGRRKYEDLNQLAISLVQPGGLFVTCSCSGLLKAEDFEETVIRAAHRGKRRLQILDRTGAGPDHPTLSNCPETRYLKVLWTRVID